jgi:precorrin-6A/cobalt-precorrin-6A reductase
MLGSVCLGSEMQQDGVVLWLIGGTGEAVTLAQGLAAAGIPCLVTVTTATARQSYGQMPNLRVRVGELEVATLVDFMRAEGMGAVLDVSHPFAVEISRGAIAAAQALGLPYWRYERPSVGPMEPKDGIHRVNNLDQVLTGDCLAGQRVLLTLGYRWLHRFAPWQAKSTLFARILPSSVALEAALAAGFTPDRLIALKPPIGADLEAALWRQWRIGRVITKASGAPGGEDVKRAIAQRLGVSLYILDRPSLDYPAVYYRQETAMAACCQWWQGQMRNP